MKPLKSATFRFPSSSGLLQSAWRNIGYSVIAMTLMFAASAASASGFLAIEGSSLTLEEKESSGVSPKGLRLRLGSSINRLMDVEGHFGFSFKDRNEDQAQMNSTYYGLYVKAFLPVGHYSALFALAGISTVNLTQEIGNTELKDSRSGGSYGFGMETRLTANADLTADYMSYLRDEGVFEEVSSFNFGIKLYF